MKGVQALPLTAWGGCAKANHLNVPQFPWFAVQVILALQQFAVGVGKHPGTPRGKGGRVQPCREALRVFLLIASRIELLKPCTLLLLLRVRDSEASLCWFLLHLTS